MYFNEENVDFSKKVIESNWEFRLSEHLHGKAFVKTHTLNLNSPDFDYVTFWKLIDETDKIEPTTDPATVKLSPISTKFLEVARICNTLKDPGLAKKHFEFLVQLNGLILESGYFAQETACLVDVVVLSSLTRCVIWSKMTKKQTDAQKVIPKLIKWYSAMMKSYGSFVTYKVDPSIQSKKNLKNTFRARLKQFAKPEFIAAVKSKNHKAVEEMLQQGTDPDSIDDSDKHKAAVHFACENGDIPMVKLLRKYNCNLESQDCYGATPIYYAIRSENIELLGYLADEGANLEHREIQMRTPLYWAACESTSEIVKFFHQRGCEVNIQSKLGRTPLQKAAFEGRADVVKYLLGVPELKLEMTDNKKRTALHYPVWGKAWGRVYGEDSPEIAGMLMDKGANPEARDENGNTPLLIASSTDAIRSVEYLLQRGVNSRAKNDDGEEALLKAAHFGNIAIVKILLEKYNADLWARNNAGVNVIGKAIEKGNVEIFEYLLNTTQFSQGMTKFKDEADQSLSEILRMIIENKNQAAGTKDFIEIFANWLRMNQTQVKIEKSLFEKLAGLKDKKIIDFLQEFAKWNLNDSLKEFLLHLFKYDWAEGLSFIVSSNTTLLDGIEIAVTELDDLQATSRNTFRVLLENVQFNIFSSTEDGNTLLTHLVEKRNTDCITLLLEYMFKISPEDRSKFRNKFLAMSKNDAWEKLIQEKNSDGLDAFEIAIVRRYMDVYNILTSYHLHNIDSKHIRIPKYEVKIIQENPIWVHKYKQQLIDLQSKFHILKEKALQGIECDEVVKAAFNESYGAILNMAEEFKKDDETFEALLSKRKYRLVSNIQEFEDAFPQIAQEMVLGVDLEYHQEATDGRSGFICLLQISTRNEDFIFDSMYLREILTKKLALIFEDAKKLKLFHGCDTDLKWLKSSFGFDVVNIYDTASAEKILHDAKGSLSLFQLAMKYLNVHLDKVYQTSDWRVRPLPKSMLEYARRDASTLILITQKQLEAFLTKDSGKIAKMAEFMEAMALVAFKKSEKSNYKLIDLIINE